MLAMQICRELDNWSLLLDENEANLESDGYLVILICRKLEISHYNLECNVQTPAIYVHLTSWKLNVQHGLNLSALSRICALHAIFFYDLLAMSALAKMYRWQKLDGWKRLDELSRTFLSLVMPWFLVPSGVFIFAAFVHACAHNSLPKFLTFVVIPLALWMGCSRCCGARIYGPIFAPSSVAALITLMTATYFLQISSATSGLYHGVFGGAGITLGATFWRVILSDPGRVIAAPNSYVYLLNKQRLDVGDADPSRYSDRLSTVVDVDDQGQQERTCSTCNVKQPLRSKHCKYCNVCIERYDHHCPAIYNCVGRKNHVQFLGLLLVFVFMELLYVNSCIMYIRTYYAFDKTTSSDTHGQAGDFYNDVGSVWEKFGEVLRGDPWMFSTATVAGTLALWQVLLLIFDIYCACCNLTTDEMFHWEKYPGLHVEAPAEPALGRPFVRKEFVNPYTQGIKQNLISFFGGQT